MARNAKSGIAGLVTFISQIMAHKKMRLAQRMDTSDHSVTTYSLIAVRYTFKTDTTT